MPTNKEIIGRFSQMFPDDFACRHYLADLKWGTDRKAFECPKCHGNGTQKSLTRAGLFRCKDCDSKISVQRNTIFEDSKLPLEYWFKAMWVMCNHEQGVNASDLKATLGLKNYSVAQGMLRKLRLAMSSNNNKCLKAMNLVVGKRRIKTLHKESPTLVIVETGNQLNRCGIRFEKIDLSDKRQFAEIIEKHIRSGAQVWARRPIYDPCLGVCFEISLLRKDEFGRESKLSSVNKVVKSFTVVAEREIQRSCRSNAPSGVFG